jgi:hypothetical protein
VGASALNASLIGHLNRSKYFNIEMYGVLVVLVVAFTYWLSQHLLFPHYGRRRKLDS